jgi:hypothetical protein
MENGADAQTFWQEFSLADVFHYNFAAMLADNGIDTITSKGPNVARWVPPFK